MEYVGGCANKFLIVLTLLSANTFAQLGQESKIFVAGHSGLVGSAIVRKLQSAGFKNLITRSSQELNLCNQLAVQKFFIQERPQFVFLAAAKVGGIKANMDYPAEFIYDNLMIQANVMQAAYQVGVEKLLFLGSSCIYPRDCAQPIKEEYLLTSLLEPSNEPYALAKIAGLKMCQAYNRQYGTNFIACMPTNLYGPGDNFNLENSHVLPALIRKFYEAKQQGLSQVVVWGSGNALREFLHVDDLADAALFLMQNYQGDVAVNIGTGQDVTIKQLAELVQKVIGYEGELVFDCSKPDGTPRKLLDVSYANSLGWEAKIDLKVGLRQTVNWYIENYIDCRK